jgi:hypothetical protein
VLAVLPEAKTIMPPLNLPYLTVNLLYLIATGTPPILLGLIWWGWFHSPHVEAPKWRRVLFFSGLCAGTANVLLFWIWAVWLRLHYNPSSWKFYGTVSDAGLFLLFYAVLAAIGGKGRYRLLLGVSGVLALLPWVPIGVL